MNKNKVAEPSFVSIVEKALREADDFMSLREVREVTGMNVNRATASLNHLWKFKVADFMSQNGVTFWYYTPETDRRTKIVPERVREDQGTRRRGVRAKPPRIE